MSVEINVECDFCGKKLDEYSFSRIRICGCTLSPLKVDEMNMRRYDVCGECLSKLESKVADANQKAASEQSV